MEQDIQEISYDIEKLRRLVEALIEKMGYEIEYEDGNRYAPQLKVKNK